MKRFYSFFLAAVALSVLPFSADGQNLDGKSCSLRGFIENVGQWPSHVLFGTRQRNADVWITRNGVVIDDYRTNGGQYIGNITHEVFTGFTLASDNDVWRGTNLSQVSFHKPGAGASVARVFDAVEIADNAHGVILSYQTTKDNRVVRTIVSEHPEQLSRLGFHILGSNQHAVQEVTPPTSTVYGSYVGGSGTDIMAGVRLLSNGEVVVSGSTKEMAFPATIGGYAKAIKGSSDAFVMRCDAKLKRVLNYTFFGGTSDERTRALHVDAQNNVYICGETSSSDMPFTTSATSKLYKAGLDAFVAKFDSTLTKLKTAFFHGGNRDDIAKAIAVDDNGVIALAGVTTSTVNMPNTMPASAALTWTDNSDPKKPKVITVPIASGKTNSGLTDGFVATFSEAGIMQQSRFYGKEGNESINAVAFDKSSNVYVVGSTSSTNFDAVPASGASWKGRLPYDATYNGGASDAFVVGFDANLSLSQSDGHTFATLLGGSKDEEARTLHVDALGKLYVVGLTNSTNMPAIGTYSTQLAGKKDVFYAQFGADGGELVGCTYFGGSGDEDISSTQLIANSSSLVVVGATSSGDFPTSGDGSVSTLTGPTDGYLSILNLGALNYSTLVSGNQADTVVSAATDKLGDPFFVVNTTSNTLRTTDTLFTPAPQGQEGYVAKLAYGTLELSSPSGGESVCTGSSRSISWAALGMADTTKFTIEYSIAGAEKWNSVAKSVGGRAYSWKVPALQTGMYVLRITTVHGHISQMLTPFMISNQPSIVTQPQSTTVCTGKPASISVSAVGAGLKFQWRKAGVNIPNANDSTLTIASLDDATAGKYDCVVSGACTPSVTSQTVTIAAVSGTQISKQPAATTTLDEGGTLTLSVVADGSDLTYQWNKNGSPIAGATTASYTVSPVKKSDEGVYTCDVSGSCGKATSTQATVSVVTTGVNDGNDDGTLISLIGPQPSIDFLVVRMAAIVETDATVRIRDNQGRLVSQQPAGGSGIRNVTINTSGLAAGRYALEVQMAGHSQTVPFLVKK